MLLHLPFSDIDICGPYKPDEVLSALDGATGIKAVPMDTSLGTLRIQLENYDDVFEYTTFRRDRYSEGGSHRPDKVEFTSDIKLDAFRRDFSVNALYCPLGGGEIIDPTGGLKDLDLGVIRTTSEYPETILKDDGLRILRMIRFACELGMFIDPGTYRCARANSSLLKDISLERVRDELNKILLSDIRYGLEKTINSPLRGLRMILNCGLFEYIIPDLLEGKGLEQAKQYHAYDVLNHSLHTCSFTPPILFMRLAGLLHDIGKPRAYNATGKMYMHELIALDMISKALGNEGLRYPNELIGKVLLLVKNHMYDLDGKTKISKLRIKFADMGIDMAKGLADLRRADVLGSGRRVGTVATEIKWREIIQNMADEGVPESIDDLAIDGNDIINITGFGPGEIIGELKRALWKKVVTDPRKNNRTDLLKFVIQYAKERYGKYC